MAKFNLDAALNGINDAQNFLNNNSNPLNQSQAQSFKADGFLVPATPSADGSGLPFTKIQNNADGQIKRNIITWFIPQFGVVRMYVNPNNIVYNDKKLITKDRTKGGFTLQYWGEELTTLSITGTTGSSGIEGINAIHEMYRAEQYAFDAVGLTLAASNAAADVANNLVQGVGGALGKFAAGPSASQSSKATAAAGGAGLLGGILGLDSPNNNLSTRNIPSLAQLAFGVEMYYNGWIFRGYFSHMSVTERADNFLFDYNMEFVATQRRGYRTNYFPWQRSAKDGPSSYTTPNSFNGNVVTGK